MTELREEDADRAAQAFRPNARPLAIAVAANLVLAIAFLGVPYLRGRSHAQASLRAFSSFTACLLGGKPGPDPGLLLPPGERSHFAALVMNAKPDWPERCRPALRAVAPEEALFVWPSVKQTGADVRAIVKLVDRELLQLARTRAAGKSNGLVPSRPLLALSKLQAGLTLLAQAVDADGALKRDAVSLPAKADVIDPARLPLMAGANAALELWPGPDGLNALALDTRGVSFLRLADGKFERARVRRSNLVRAGVHDDDEAVLLFATAEERCAKDEHRCLRRGTGIAYLESAAVELPEPVWLGGHPAGRADRSVRLGLMGRVDVLVRASAEGAVELRRFTLDRKAGDGTKGPPLSPVERFPVPAAAPPVDTLLLGGQQPAVVYALASAEGVRAELFGYGEGTTGTPVALGSVRGKGGFVEACESGGERYVAYGSDEELALVRLAPEGTLEQVQPPLPLALGAIVPRDENRRDRVRLLCGENAGPSLFVLDAEHALSALRCTREACVRGPVLARDVIGFDALLAGEAPLVAYTLKREPQIRVLRLDAQGAPLAAPVTPAPCWDPDGGLCGVPSLTVAGPRIVLGARQGGDLLALESDDGGVRWKALSGLQLAGAINTDANAPLQQHRVRKGLD